MRIPYPSEQILGRTAALMTTGGNSQSSSKTLQNIKLGCPLSVDPVNLTNLGAQAGQGSSYLKYSQPLRC